MAYRIKLSSDQDAFAVRLTTGGFMRVSLGAVQYVNTGKPGIDGTTFYPEVTGENCTLSWTNDGGKPNPAPVDLRGKQGPPGSDADVVPITNMELEELLK